MHGWSDWVLQLQPFFSEHAAELFQVLSSADLIVGHNVEFDLAFLGRELRAAGQPSLTQAPYCTMKAFKDRFPGESANLDACIAKIGGRRQGARHGALEDAVLSVCLYRWLEFGHPQFMVLEHWLSPSNLRERTPEPSPPWPARKRRTRRASEPSV
jgi:DNA polymerase-3 subunit epsilon